MATTTKTDELVAHLRATTVVARLGASDGVALPESIKQAAGLSDGDTVYLEALGSGDGVIRVQVRKIDPDQAWFWTKEWQAGEREADEEIKAGQGRVFYSEEDFLASLEDDALDDDADV